MMGVKLKYVITFILAAYLFLIASPILAQVEDEASDSESKSAASEDKKAVDIGEVVIIAPQPGVEISTEKTIIDVDKFKKPGEVKTLIDVLAEIGGIDVQRVNPLMASPGDEVSIRGLNEGRMVIEIDGRRINHTGHYGRFIVDWSTLNLDDVERIEIIRGGHSVLHPYAIGGVINIITKKGKRGADRPDVKVNLGWGKYDTYSMSASLVGGIKDYVGYQFSAGKQATDGYLRNNFQIAENINGHLTFYLPREAVLTLGGKYSEIIYGFPVINDPARSDYDSDYPEFYPSSDQLRHLSINQPPGPPQPEAGPECAEGDTSCLEYKKRYEDYRAMHDSIVPDPHWLKNTQYLNAELLMPLGSGTARVNYFVNSGKRWTSMYEQGKMNEMRVDDLTEGVIVEYRDVEFFDINRLTLGAEYQELGWPDSSTPLIYVVRSAYLQDIINIKDRALITVGVRYYDLYMHTYYTWFERGDEEPGWPTGGKTESERDWYPSIKIDYQASLDTSLYAAVSRSTRLPCP